MAFILSAVGVVISVGFITIGAMMNWRYGAGLGRSADEQHLYAAAHLLIDVCKVIMPFFGWWAYAQRRVSVAAGAALVTVAAIVYSAIGIAGFVDMSRAVTSGSLIAKKDSVGDWKEELARSRRRLKDLGSYEPASVLEQRLQQLRQDARWISSKQCAEATTKMSKEFCIDVSGIETERAKAIEAGKLEMGAQELRDKINASAGAAAIELGDPRAEIVARTTGWELLRVQTWLSLLFVGIIESMSTFGMFLSLNHGEMSRILAEWRARARAIEPNADRKGTSIIFSTDVRTQRDTPRQSPARHAVPRSVTVRPDAMLIENHPAGQLMNYISSETEPAAGGVELADLHADYMRWCALRIYVPMSIGTFEVELDHLRALPEVGQHLTKFGSRYIGIGLQQSNSTARKRKSHE